MSDRGFVKESSITINYNVLVIIIIIIRPPPQSPTPPHSGVTVKQNQPGYADKRNSLKFHSLLSVEIMFE